MAKLLLTTALVLASLAVGGARAYVGSHQLGCSAYDLRDQYIMCGKCTWDPLAGTVNSVYAPTADTAHYMLDCSSTTTTTATVTGPGAVTASASVTKWATLKYHCNSDCSSCANTTDIVIGAAIGGTYATDVVGAPRVAASVQCCPQYVEVQHFADETCSSSSSSSTFHPAGCSWNAASSTFDQMICTTAGQPPQKWNTGCSGSLSSGDGDCPATSSCLVEITAQNKPCVNLTATATTSSVTASLTATSAGYTNQTVVCRKDASLMCLRAVRQTRYTASMTPADNGALAGLSCASVSANSTCSANTASSASSGSASIVEASENGASIAQQALVVVVGIALLLCEL